MTWGCGGVNAHACVSAPHVHYYAQWPATLTPEKGVGTPEKRGVSLQAPLVRLFIHSSWFEVSGSQAALSLLVASSSCDRPPGARIADMCHHTGLSQGLIFIFSLSYANSSLNTMNNELLEKWKQRRLAVISVLDLAGMKLPSQVMRAVRPNSPSSALTTAHGHKTLRISTGPWTPLWGAVSQPFTVTCPLCVF